MLGVGSDDKPLLQHWREVIPVEVNPALDPDRRAKRRRLHRSVESLTGTVPSRLTRDVIPIVAQHLQRSRSGLMKNAARDTHLPRSIRLIVV